MGADKLMGDGAGILIQIPDQLYREEMAGQGVELPPAGEYGVGMVFLPKEHASRLACEQELERAIKAEGQVLLGWRDVPVNRDMPMSPAVREKEPILRQVFIGRGADVIVQDALERKLYVIRKTGQRRDPEPRAQAQQRVLRAQHEQPHRGLQGPAAGGAGGRVLPGPGRRALRLGHRPGAPALLDEHLPRVAARPTPTATWRTTARSTPCAATTTGCWRARA
ncbi:glutamate synthase large subunit [Alicycliphilus sp. B1]|nr:glutamate synthase large subunit [Alicycliphilus sp. B1]